jgi:hypothetical protein
MDRICKISIHWKNSPLCNNWELFNLWKRISEDRGADRKIILGIMYSESHIGANWAGTCNSSWNNRWWVKARRGDDQKVKRDQPIPNNWCWLYKFDSMENYFITKANIIGDGYKWCFNRNTTRDKVTCISRAYVGSPHKAEQSWINNVMKIAY